MQIGQRVSYSGELCTIRYIGPVEGTKGDWLGVEWDDPNRGKHDGEAGGKRYFRCLSREAKAASFIRPNRPADSPRTFLEALRFKYASEHIQISFQIGMPAIASQNSIRISGKEVEEVGFDKIRKQLAELHELRIVLLDGLNIWQPVADALFQRWKEAPVVERPVSRFASDIYETCPKITELDLSRNLFRSFDEVAAVCEQLANLKLLKLDGNRFQGLDTTASRVWHFRSIFAKVEILGVENTLMSWREIVELCGCFPALKSLSISHNDFEGLDPSVSLAGFPPVQEIKLESNKLTSLARILTLAQLPKLGKLALKYNSIVSAYTDVQDRIIFPGISDLDVSFNAVSSWAFVDDLSKSFPALSSLRVSHNPLYANLHSPAGRELTADDGYMLTIARLPKLKMLNLSAVSDKDRLNAETYYLSLIVQELSLSPASEAGQIKARHPRWVELCAEYGEPEIKRDMDHVDPRSLAARVLNLEVEVSEAAAVVLGCEPGFRFTSRHVPKRFNIYSVLGLTMKPFPEVDHVPPGLSLVHVTDDWEELDGKIVRREVKLVPETRGIGTFIEERAGRLRLDFKPPQPEGPSYEHPVAQYLQQLVESN